MMSRRPRGWERGGAGLTFTLGNEPAPHGLALRQLAGDGVGALRLDEALLAHHRDGAAQLEAVAEAPTVDGHSRVGALVVPERWGGRERGEKRR